MPSILFVSYSALHDSSSGAAASIRDMYALIAPLGWTCRAFTGPMLDRGGSIADALAALGAAYDTIRADSFAVHRTRHDGTATAIYHPDSPATVEAQVRFVALVEHVLRASPPDLLLTFGSGWQARATLALAHVYRVPVLFWLRNPEYSEASLFEGVAATLVPSQALADHYRQTLGIQTTPLPSPIDVRRTRCERVDPTHVTFVNPIPHKGVLYFAGIVNELFRRRSDIPVQVVESRGGARSLELVGIDVSRLRVVPHTPDPRELFAHTRVLVVPSLWLEAFGRVVVEAQQNGIPVLSSDRGALAETVGDGGLVFHVPAAYQPATLVVPSSEEVAPWVEAIIRLFDDPAEYARQQERARNACRRFEPETLAPRYDQALREALVVGTHVARVGPASLGEVLTSLGQPLPSPHLLPSDEVTRGLLGGLFGG